jgi:hypothetical protein
MAIPTPREGSAALITGASSGIGAELARQLCARGHDAILVARRRDRLEELAAQLRARHGRRVEVIACDVSDARARTQLLAETGDLGLGVDVLVLCAGFGMVGPFLAQPCERVTAMVRTNVEALMALTHAFAAPMAARRAGAVLIVSSMAGNQPMPHFGAYAATKAAVTSFAESLHCELRGSGVIVTALCPGGVRTEFSAVAGALDTEDRMPAAFMIGAEECAGAGLEGLEQGRRIVMPRRAVRMLAWFGAHAPRAVWLPLCRKLMA